MTAAEAATSETDATATNATDTPTAAAETAATPSGTVTVSTGRRSARELIEAFEAELL